MATVKIECQRAFYWKAENYYRHEVVEVPIEDAREIVANRWAVLTDKPVYRIDPSQVGNIGAPQPPSPSGNVDWDKALADVDKLARDVASKSASAASAASTAAAEAAKAAKAAESITQKTTEVTRAAEQVSTSAAAAQQAAEAARAEVARLEALARSLQGAGGNNNANVGDASDYEF